jgi:hypothetical protein
MTVDRGGFRVRGPKGIARQRFRNEDDARRAALLLQEKIDSLKQKALTGCVLPTVSMLVRKFETEPDDMAWQPWKDSTKHNNGFMFRKIERELGKRTLQHLDVVQLKQWLAKFCVTGDQWLKWRHLLVLLWGHALSNGLVPVNEAEKLPKHSASRKLAVNRKKRQPLTLETFRAIRERAEPWLQLAMDLSMLTLQSRNEVLNMKHADFRGGYLYVIRAKVSHVSDMGFIRITITPELEELRRHALSLDDAVSPFLVHRATTRPGTQWQAGKKHWTAIEPGFLTHAFAEARDRTGLWALPSQCGLRNYARPSFHEIRGLAARTCRDHGANEDEIRALMTHSNRRTAAIYLDKGTAGLRDSDYIPVRTHVSLREILKPRDEVRESYQRWGHSTPGVSPKGVPRFFVSV